MVPGQEGVEGTGVNETIQKGVDCKAKRDPRGCQPGERITWTSGQRMWVLCCPQTWSHWSQPGVHTLSLLLGESVQPSSLPGTQEASGLASVTAETSPIPQQPALAWTTGRPERGTHYQELITGDQRGELITHYQVSSPWWGASISFPLLLACPDQALPLLTKASQPPWASEGS